MTSRERVHNAFAHVQPDCTPCDYFGTPEIDQALETVHPLLAGKPAKQPKKKKS